MQFTVDKDLLNQSRAALFKRNNIFWIVGGAGSGKTTICQALSAKYNIPIYDMDAHIYGTYHGRFTQERHPVNKAWSTAQNGLAWLLNMSWDEFNSFNKAALSEYLSLLAEDLEELNRNNGLLIDGGIINPSLVTQVLPPNQIVCLAFPEHSNIKIWETAERLPMKETIYQLPNPEEMWQKFLEFDARINQEIEKESRESKIPICSRGVGMSIEEYTEQVANALRIPKRNN